MTDVTGDPWIHDDGTECTDPGDHKCHASLVTAGFRHAETVHLCPPGRSGGLMPCCGLTPFEVPRTDRMTLDPALVTCSTDEPEDECEGAP